MKIETKRLILRQLNSQEEKLWLDHLDELEQKLAVSYQGEAMTGFIREIVKQQINRVSKFPTAHFFGFLADYFARHTYCDWFGGFQNTAK